MTALVATEDRLPDLAGVNLWLHAGGDAAWRVEAEAGTLAGIPRLQAADLLQRKASELRRPFLDWVGGLARRHDSAEWWASQLAARTSYGGFYARLCSLAVAAELLPGLDGTVLAVCATPALAAEVARATGAERPREASTRAARRPLDRALRAWTRLAPERLHALPGRVSDATQTLLDSDPRYRRRVLAEHGLLEPRAFGGSGTALLFTWIDERSFDAEGRYRDPHLGPLPQLLRERGLEVALVARVLHTLPFADAIGRLVASGETFVFPDAYVTPEDHRACAERAGAFAPEIPDDDAVAGVPVARLAREHVAEQRPAQSTALALEPLVRRFTEAGVRPERIVHTCEGHAWELVLAYAVRRHLPATTIVGYENLNMPRLALSMFSAPAELGIRPLPDRIVTNGPAYAEVLVQEGMPADLVRAGCGLRHASLWEAPRRRAGTGHVQRVLAATEIALGPAVELVQKAADAFADDPRRELVVKCHPLVDRAELLRALGPRADSLRFAEAPIAELLANADVLLYTYSAVAIEALALGVPPVFVRSECGLDLDQLEFAGELRLEGRTPEQLRRAAEEYATLAPGVLESWRAAAREAAARAVAPPDPECVEAFL